MTCCSDYTSHSLCAVKCTPTSDKPDNKDLNEHTILKSLNHNRVVSLFATHLFEGHLYLVLEFLYGVNLVQHLSFKTRYSEETVAMVIQQILDGLEYLHHQKVVHLNLQPSSVVMATRRCVDVRLVDFSLAQALENSTGHVVPLAGHPEFIGKSRLIFFYLDVYFYLLRLI